MNDRGTLGHQAENAQPHSPRASDEARTRMRSSLVNNRSRASGDRPEQHPPAQRPAPFGSNPPCVAATTHENAERSCVVRQECPFLLPGNRSEQGYSGDAQLGHPNRRGQCAKGGDSPKSGDTQLPHHVLSLSRQARRQGTARTGCR